MVFKFIIFNFCLILVRVRCSNEWNNLPQLPSGRRAEYYLIRKDGGYKYGFDTGTGIFAKQSADAANEVEGHFVHQAGGVPVDVKYRAGVQGYVPEILSPPSSIGWSQASSVQDNGDNSPSSDGSYSFSYSHDGSSRRESADAAGNVQGQYSYTDEAGRHDLYYKAGDGTGFVVTGGSLSVVPGVPKPSAARPHSESNGNGWKNDGSYSFSYSSDLASRSESADSSGLVQGQYSYTDSAGRHDLLYKAGDDIGFVVTGGSLAGPFEVRPAEAGTPATPPPDSGPTSADFVGPSPSGSYSFSYTNPDSSRTESANDRGNVEGSYSYRNEAGQHDLIYKAGAETGFLPIGGSLATPNGLARNGEAETTTTESLQETSEPVSQLELESGSGSGVGSFSFSYSSGNSARSESADASGNVNGRYSYTDDSGYHDLTYKAGDETGFLVTGGNLAAPTALSSGSLVSTTSPDQPTEEQTASTPQTLASELTTTPSPPSAESSSEEPQSNSDDSDGDGSYSFSYQSPESSRSESADAGGNVQGEYSYTDNAGFHNLIYKADDSGFVVTGGNLASPHELQQTSEGQGTPTSDASPTQNAEYSTEGSQASSRAYGFSYSTADSSRRESADENGNVQGYYSYVNEAGKHDLSYNAGAEKGFVVKGGSLAIPNGISTEANTANRQQTWTGRRKIHFASNGLNVINYLPVSANIKSGYVFQ